MPARAQVTVSVNPLHLDAINPACPIREDCKVVVTANTDNRCAPRQAGNYQMVEPSYH